MGNQKVATVVCEKSMLSIVTANARIDGAVYSNEELSVHGDSEAQAVGNLLLKHAMVRLAGKNVKPATTARLGDVQISEVASTEDDVERQEGVLTIQFGKCGDRHYAYLDHDTLLSAWGKSPAEAIGQALLNFAMVSPKQLETRVGSTRELSKIHIFSNVTPTFHPSLTHSEDVVARIVKDLHLITR